MVKSLFYTSNKYFGEIVKKTLNNKKWKQNSYSNKGSTYVDVDYPNNKCNDCLIINQFNNIDTLGNKYLQYQSMFNYFNGKLPYYIPLTFKFTKQSMNTLKILFRNKIMWIIKPENSLARRGVTVVDSYNKLKESISSTTWNNWIIQKYINNPLLLNNKKFHFRLYVIVLKYKNQVNTYYYNKGFIYTADKPFNINDLSNDVQLSGENSKNNVYIFPQKIIELIGKDKYNNIILPQFKEIVKNTIRATYHTLICPNQDVSNNKCFKLLGYDILIDKNLKLYLAEINGRLISLKYPPKNFKEEFYNNVLNLVLLNKIPTSKQLKKYNIKFTHISTEYLDKIIEGFVPEVVINMSYMNSKIWKKNIYLIVILILLLTLLLLL